MELYTTDQSAGPGSDPGPTSGVASDVIARGQDDAMNLSDRDKRILKIAAPVLGGILVLFLAYTLFLGGGSEDVASPGPVPPTSSPLPTTTASPSVTPSASPLIVFAGRDPFSHPPLLASASSPGIERGPLPAVRPRPRAACRPRPHVAAHHALAGHGQGHQGQDHRHPRHVHPRRRREGPGGGRQQRPTRSPRAPRFAGNYRLVSITGECGDFLYGEESFTLCTNAQK